MNTDLRSDTVTRPTPEMLEAMSVAPVGDDVFREDPTVNSLEERMAELFGMEAGLFVPSGTMSNQLAIRILAGPGDEVILDETGHLFNYESGAASLLSGVQLHPLRGEYGKLTPDLIRGAIRPQNDWDPHSRVVAIENTTNKGGGAVYREGEIEGIRLLCSEAGLKLHLDGARIWNAMEVSGTEPGFFGRMADTISICFSKGLGAPVGSMILAGKQEIARARRFRKMWGGGMRQAGLLAAAAAYAVEHHRPLLKEDHRRARKFAKAVAGMNGFSIDPDRVESNIVLFDVNGRSANAVLEQLAEEGVGMVAFGPKTIRATFHFQVADDGLKHALEALARVNSGG
ncbi:MAG: GntG family PLP-dependent aldolase [Balneolaceae bacterium]